MHAALTIAIPTYNRNAILVENLSKLLPQLDNRCELLIIDNCSATPVQASIKTLLDSYPKVRVRVVRNPKNIGGNANLCRCFELCQTDWIWVVGDDDEPSGSAISTIHASLENRSDVIVHHFDVPGHPSFPAYAIERQTIGAADYVASCPSLGAIMFIPSAVYNANIVGSYLAQGNFYAYTCAPHVVMSLLALNDSGKACFHREAIITWTVPDLDTMWSGMTLALAFGTILDVPFTEKCWRALFVRIGQERSARSGVFGFAGTLCATFSIDVQRERIRWLYRQAVFRNLSIGTTIMQKLLFHAIGVLIMFRRLSRAILLRGALGVKYHRIARAGGTRV